MSATGVDPQTGELVDLAEEGREFVRLSEAVAEAEAELARLRERMGQVEMHLAAHLPDDAVIDTGRHIIGWGPPARRPAQRADMNYAERYREVLLDLGIGTLKLATIKGADVKANAVRLRAAGVDPDRLLPDPGAGALVLRVETEAAA